MPRERKGTDFNGCSALPKRKKPARGWLQCSIIWTVPTIDRLRDSTINRLGCEDSWASPRPSRRDEQQGSRAYRGRPRQGDRAAGCLARSNPVERGKDGRAAVAARCGSVAVTRSGRAVPTREATGNRRATD